MSLEIETKETLGFKNTAATCSTCKHCKEVECLYQDRMWYDNCTYSNLCNFRVKTDSTCEKHEPKAK